MLRADEFVAWMTGFMDAFEGAPTAEQAATLRQMLLLVRVSPAVRGIHPTQIEAALDARLEKMPRGKGNGKPRGQ
jgi:hypothetical protein